ncbi:hypothetical protein [Streptomyces nigrescens]|uniref:hypothetical protein n=1 Tax=Streptomyces nigrescens TaxID=1920 RepID=UPI0036FF5B39
MTSNGYDATPPECFTEEYAFYERRGYIPWGGPVYPDAREDPDPTPFPPEPVGPEVIIPGVFLDAHATAPGAVSDALRTLLADAQHRVFGTTPRAVVEVPTGLLEQLAAYADNRLFVWDRRTQNLACRSAGVLGAHVRGVLAQEKRRRQELEELVRAASAPSCPEGEDRACPTSTCGCAPF